MEKRETLTEKRWLTSAERLSRADVQVPALLMTKDNSTSHTAAGKIAENRVFSGFL